MKILAFTDMHGSLKALRKLKKKSRKADVIVCAGDISIFEQKLEYFLKQFDKLNKPFLIIPGNHETSEDMEAASMLFENMINIHKKTYKTNNCLFMGYGEGGFSMVDKEFERKAKKFEKEIKKNKDMKVVLVTHAPPYKTRLDDIGGSACGNKSIKNFIKKMRPDLVITGHLHENAGKTDSIEKTRLINPGPYGEIISL